MAEAWIPAEEIQHVISELQYIYRSILAIVANIYLLSMVNSRMGGVWWQDPAEKRRLFFMETWSIILLDVGWQEPAPGGNLIYFLATSPLFFGMNGDKNHQANGQTPLLNL